MNPFPAVFISLPAKIFIFPDKNAPNVPYNILIIYPFSSSTSFWIFSLTPFNNKPESLRNLTIFIISSNSAFDISGVVLLDRDIFYLFLNLLLIMLLLILIELKYF